MVRAVSWEMRLLNACVLRSLLDPAPSPAEILQALSCYVKAAGSHPAFLKTVSKSAFSKEPHLVSVLWVLFQND